MSIEVVVKHAATTIGEGPHWDDATQTLTYVDIESGIVGRWNSVTGDQKIKLDGGPVGFIVPRRTGGYIIGLGRSLSHLDWDTRKVTTIAEKDQGLNTRFNDGKCDASGRVFAGTMGKEISPAVVAPEKGSLYSLETDKTTKTHLNKITISNGLAWTEDNRTMYYIDSTPRKVYAFDYDLSTGTMSNQRTVVQFKDGMGFPDGMTIDHEEKIWVACYGAGKVLRFDPETGKELRSIAFPRAKRITSCCWGGTHLDDLYVTCCKKGVTDEDFRGPENEAGSIFKVTGLGVRGKSAYMYEG